MSDIELPIRDTQPRPVAAITGLAPGAVADWLAWGSTELAGHSDSPRADAEILLAALLGSARAELAARAADQVEAALVLRYAGWIERRRQGEPVAYITGRQGFWTLDLTVDSSVLIPRPDTETLVEWALEIARSRHVVSIADLGTGSGAIALALASELPASCRIVAIDTSRGALDIARQNAAALGISSVVFLEGSWFEPIADRRFDLIVSNPPYVAEDDAHLAALRYEPRAALTSGADGLDAIREIVDGARAHLEQGGMLLLEHGAEQGGRVRALLHERGFADIATRFDFGSKERVTGGRTT